MKRSIRFLLAAAMAFGVGASAAKADPTAEKIKKLRDTVGGSLVAVQYEYSDPLSGPSPGTLRGIVINDDGWVLTSESLLPSITLDSRIQNIKIVVPSQSLKEVEATLVGRDPANRLAYFKPNEPHGVPAFDFSTAREPAIGEEVAAIGLLNRDTGYEPEIAVARISSILRWPVTRYLTRPQSLTPAGSIVVDMEGRAVGLIDAQPPVITAVQGPQGSQQISIPRDQAFSMAPAAKLGAAVKELVTITRKTKGWLGIAQLEAAPKTICDRLDIEGKGAIMVVQLIADGPAEKAGVQRGDIIVKIDGEPIELGPTPQSTVQRLDIPMQGRRAGEKIAFDVRRAGVEGFVPHSVEVELIPLPKSAEEADIAPSQQLGLLIRDLVEMDKFSQTLAEDTTGVVVQGVQPGAPGARAGLQANDIIIKLNDQRVNGAQKFIKQINQLVTKSQRTFNLIILQGQAGGARRIVKVQL
jgi:serine protease Do